MGACGGKVEDLRWVDDRFRPLILCPLYRRSRWPTLCHGHIVEPAELLFHAGVAGGEEVALTGNGLAGGEVERATGGTAWRLGGIGRGADRGFH